MDFKNKVIIVTGASSGIGRAAAEHLSQLGGSVVITGRNEEELKITASNCSSSETLIVVADVTKGTDREKIINETIKKFGKIDVLVNNAGLGFFANVVDLKMDDYDKIMDLNVTSVFHLTQLAIPHLIVSQGNIVNVSSVFGLRPSAGKAAYCMSKAALDQFTKCLALELAPKNVRVNAINPAAIKTNCYKGLGLSEEAYEGFLKSLVASHPLQRIGTVVDTSHAIAFLASDLSTFITGTTLAVDGGFVQMGPR